MYTHELFHLLWYVHFDSYFNIVHTRISVYRIIWIIFTIVFFFCLIHLCAYSFFFRIQDENLYYFRFLENFIDLINLIEYFCNFDSVSWNFIISSNLFAVGDCISWMSDFVTSQYELFLTGCFYTNFEHFERRRNEKIPKKTFHFSYTI